MYNVPTVEETLDHIRVMREYPHRADYRGFHPNVELLDETMDHILDHPEEWDQMHWSCGTKACFAGLACILSGDKVRNGVFGWAISSEGQSKRISDRAIELLGLDLTTAWGLFAGSNKVDDLKTIVGELTGPATYTAPETS